MNVFRCLMRFELVLEKFLCGRNCMKSAKEQQHNFKRNSWGILFFHHFFGHNGNIFLWISSEILMHSFCMSIEILLNSFYFFCIFVCSFYAFLIFLRNFLWISYACLMHFLWISYAFLMQFLCISYAILMQFLQLHTFWAKVYAVLAKVYEVFKTA